MAIPCDDSSFPLAINFTQGSVYMGLPWSLSGKEAACNAGDLGSIPGSGRSSGAGHSSSILVHTVFSMEWSIPTPVFLPGECHGQRSLVGYSPRGHTEPDTTEVTSAAAAVVYIYQRYPLNSSHPIPFPLLCPHIHSLSLHLCS